MRFFAFEPEEPGGVDEVLELERVRRGEVGRRSGSAANTAGVTLLTISSVHWAERIVATSSWNGVSCTSAHSSCAVPGYSPASRSRRPSARALAPHARRAGRGFAQSSSRGRPRRRRYPRPPWSTSGSLHARAPDERRDSPATSPTRSRAARRAPRVRRRRVARPRRTRLDRLRRLRRPSRRRARRLPAAVRRDRTTTGRVRPRRSIVHPDHRDGDVPGALLDAGDRARPRRGDADAREPLGLRRRRRRRRARGSAAGLTRRARAVADARPAPARRRARSGPPASPCARSCPAPTTTPGSTVNNRRVRRRPRPGRLDRRDPRAAAIAEPWFDPAGFLIADDGGAHRRLLLDQGPPARAAARAARARRDLRHRRRPRRTRAPGLGRALVARRARPPPRVARIDVGMLFVDAANTPAVGLYRALGFVTSRIDRAYVRPRRREVDA